MTQEEIAVRAELARELSGGKFGSVSVISKETVEQSPHIVEQQKEQFDTVIVEPLQSPEIELDGDYEVEDEP